MRSCRWVATVGSSTSMTCRAWGCMGWPRTSGVQPSAGSSSGSASGASRASTSQRSGWLPLKLVVSSSIRSTRPVVASSMIATSCPGPRRRVVSQPSLMSRPSPTISRLVGAEKNASEQPTARPPLMIAARSSRPLWSAASRRSTSGRPSSRRRATPPSGWMSKRTWLTRSGASTSNRWAASPRRSLRGRSCTQSASSPGGPPSVRVPHSSKAAG